MIWWMLPTSLSAKNQTGSRFLANFQRTMSPKRCHFDEIDTNCGIVNRVCILKRGGGRLWLGQFARSIYFSLATGLIQQVTSQLSFFYNGRLSTVTICPSHRATLRIVSTRSCSTRGWVPGHCKEKESGQNITKWKRTGETGIWSYLRGRPHIH